MNFFLCTKFNNIFISFFILYFSANYTPRFFNLFRIYIWSRKTYSLRILVSGKCFTLPHNLISHLYFLWKQLNHPIISLFYFSSLLFIFIIFTFWLNLKSREAIGFDFWRLIPSFSAMSCLISRYCSLLRDFNGLMVG